jgi:threonine dehydrogenase-like Zn-dependent dehydrogenase
MKALRYNHDKGLRLEDVNLPKIEGQDALIRVLRAGICSTDLEIIAGYVPGFDHTLGHEFVGIVEAVADVTAHTHLVGGLVVGEINCPCEPCTDHPEDPVFARNHAPNRTVLGIIGRDGAMAERVVVPVANLHVVPDGVTVQQACFAEPLAAACRIVEQRVVKEKDAIAVVGDGKLGLLVAHALVTYRSKLESGVGSVSLFGRHPEKMALVQGLERRCVVEDDDSVLAEHQGKFDVVIEATGSPRGISLAAGLCRPLGRIVLKSTCSVADPNKVPLWSALANDLVVNEKTVVGSRCGPFPPALNMLRDVGTQRLVDAMVDHCVPLERGVEAIEMAQRKGALKVQIVVSDF